MLDNKKTNQFYRLYSIKQSYSSISSIITYSSTESVCQMDLEAKTDNHTSNQANLMCDCRSTMMKSIPPSFFNRRVVILTYS